MGKGNKPSGGKRDKAKKKAKKLKPNGDASSGGIF